jgi:hypothetical protein
MLEEETSYLPFVDRRISMSEPEDIEEVMRARAVAGGLAGGNVCALLDLEELLKGGGTPERIAGFVLQVIFELLSTKAQHSMIDVAQEKGHENVIDPFERKPHRED